MHKKGILAACLSVILVLGGFCGYQVHMLSAKQEKIKQDYSIINNVSFGLLSVNNWRDQVEGIISARINSFSLTPTEKDDLKKEIEDILQALVTKALSKINQTPKTLGGKIKKLAFKTMVDTTDLHKQVPSFAQKIVDQVNRPSSREKLKDIAQSKLEELSKQTYDSSLNEMNHTTDSVFSFYAVTEKAGFDKKAAAMLIALRQKTYDYVYGMLAMIIAIFGFWWWLKNKPLLHNMLFVFSVGAGFVLLLVGVTTT